MQRYLLASDFDGTIAQTFQKSPKGMDVHKAYDLAIYDIFGPTGREIYQQILGGLKNRAPSELVGLLIQHDSRNETLTHARNFFEQEGTNLNSWEEVETKKILTELLVRRKLFYLYEEIGTRFSDGQVWPRPCEGFLDFWRFIGEINAKGSVRLDTAIISSGHDLFIEKTFSGWGLSQPNILVTEDDVRGRTFPIEMERRVKPGQLQLALAYRRWLEEPDLKEGRSSVSRALDPRGRIIYFGDDIHKDGKFAGFAKIGFGWFNPEGKLGEIGTNGFVFKDWRDITIELTNHEKALQEGEPLAEIFGYKGSTIESRHSPHPERE